MHVKCLLYSKLNYGQYETFDLSRFTIQIGGASYEYFSKPRIFCLI